MKQTDAPKAKKPKAKKFAGINIWKRRNKLQELAERGINGERQNAIEALAALEEKYDFSKPRPMEATDLFHGIEVEADALGACRPVATFERMEAALADFVKWAICARFNVEGRWQDHGWEKRTLHLQVKPSSVAGLAGLAENMARTFAKLWDTFNQLPGATIQDARLFMRGLYDGMMDDQRASGERLPDRHVQKVKRGKQNAPAGVAVHPYAIALALGKDVRLSVPAADLAENLIAANERARLAA